MTNMTDRNRLRQELTSIGYSLDYINEWQPKTRLYRHTPSRNINGEVSEDIGTYIDNVPGAPDYVLRKSRIGLFRWPPTIECECQWCTERVQETLEDKCPKCEFEPKGETPQAISSSLRMHMQHRHKEEVKA